MPAKILCCYAGWIYIHSHGYAEKNTKKWNDNTEQKFYDEFAASEKP